MFIVVTTQEAIQAFAHPALDLLTGEIIELAAEPAPVQLELFTEPVRLPREALDEEGMRA